jgi:hypothetical protein
MEQLAPAAKLAPQLFANTNEGAFVPVTVMLVMESVASPELVKVTACDALAIPTFTEPNDRLVAESFTPAAATPVPLRAMDCGEPTALSVMVMAAVRAPEDTGAKCPCMEQFAPAARLVPQPFAKTKEEAFDPVTLMLEMDKAALPVLVIVRD